MTEKTGRVGVSSLEETGKEGPFYSLAPTTVQVSEQRTNSIKYMTWGVGESNVWFTYFLNRQ